MRRSRMRCWPVALWFLANCFAMYKYQLINSSFKHVAPKSKVSSIKIRKNRPRKNKNGILTRQTFVTCRNHITLPNLLLPATRIFFCYRSEIFALTTSNENHLLSDFFTNIYAFKYSTTHFQTDRQVVASGRKLNLGRDLRWVTKRTSKFPRKYTQVAKKHF